ncbi:MAG: hypothetical protein MSA56_10385 [Clostridium sp.]|nr:hypothetical protein [Clostridium sp.]
MNDLDIKRLMADYNHFNDREIKAEIFFREHVDNVEQKHIDAYISIIKQLSTLQTKIEKAIGRKMTNKEIFHGFKID